MVDAGQVHVMLAADGQHIVQQIGRDTELGLLAGGDDLLVVAGADAGIEAHHDAAAPVDAAQGLQLRERVHADEQAGIKGVLHFLTGNIVGNVQDLVRGEARQLVEIEFAGAHGVHHQPFFADNAQQNGVGIGLDRIVHREAGMSGQGLQFAATRAQHVFVVDIEGVAPFLHQLGRRMPAEEIERISVAGTNVGHWYTSKGLRAHGVS